jgi:hypothetical protein
MTTNNKQRAKSKEDINARFPKETKTKTKNKHGKTNPEERRRMPSLLPFT